MANKSSGAARQQPVTQKGNNDSTEKWLPWALAVFAFILFGIGFRNEMLSIDDNSATVNNPAVTNLELFTTFNLGMYAPLTWLGYAIAFFLGEDNGLWYHVLSALVHGLNVALVFQLFRRLGSSVSISGVIAFFFAIHPLQVEPVAWIAGFSTPLFSLFNLLAMNFYLRYCSTGQIGRYYWLSLGMFLLACLSKSAAVVLPLTLFALDFWMKRGWSTKTLVEKLPFFALSVGFGVLTLFSRDQVVHVDQPGDFSVVDRLLMACHTILFYWTKLIAPINLSIWYPFEKTGENWPWTYYLAPAVLLASVYGAWRTRQHMPFLWFGLVFYLSNVVFSLPWSTFGTFELRSDRYNYLASLGFFAILLALPGYFAAKKPSWRGPVQVILGALAVLWLIGTVSRILVWKDSVTLIENAMAATGDNFGKAYLWRGTILADDGKGDDALKDFNKAIEKNPLLYDVYKYRGNIMGLRKNYAQSVNDLSKYIEEYPQAAPEIYNRGLSYVNLGNDSLAMADFNRCLEIDPDFARAYRARGNTYLKWGEIAKGQADLERYEALKPQ